VDNILYLTFLAIALFLNIKDSKNISLLAMVVFSYYFPTDYITSRNWWWFSVLSIDLIVLYAAFKSDCLASKAVLLINIMMLDAHFLEVATYIPRTYKFIIEYLEHLQIVAFIMCAPNPINYLKRKVKRWLKYLKKSGYGY